MKINLKKLLWKKSTSNVLTTNYHENFFKVKNKNNRIEKEIPCNYKPIIKLARN